MPWRASETVPGSVADAGGNDLLKVDKAPAHISTLAVLPPQPVTVTAQQAAALGAPDCLVGETYAFEPVPTDVEVGPGGRLWVTTLPGGPEDPSLGARGSLYSVGQGGRSTRVATGFSGATNLALSGDGSAYVTELFGGKISKVNRSTGKVSTFKQLAERARRSRWRTTSCTPRPWPRPTPTPASRWATAR